MYILCSNVNTQERVQFNGPVDTTWVISEVECHHKLINNVKKSDNKTKWLKTIKLV